MVRNLAFFDIDKTLYDGFLTPDLMYFLADRGVVSQQVKIDYAEIAENYTKGAISYQDEVILDQETFAKHARGLESGRMDKEAEHFVNRTKKLYPWVEKLFQELATLEFDSYLVSAAASPLVKALQKRFKIKDSICAVWEEKNGKYSGKVAFVPGAPEKQAFTASMMTEQDNPRYVIGFGDSTSDVEMLKITKRGFVINPQQPEMITLAKTNGWRIIQPDDSMVSILREELRLVV